MESAGDVVFFKDMRGEAARALGHVEKEGKGEGGHGVGSRENGDGVVAVVGQDEKEDVMVD